ncbi:MAG: IS3 family transposase, partial [Sarcina sp.]
NCYDNACIENFFGHLKTELIYLSHFKTKEELFTAIDDYIYWYNHSRYQIKENRTPIELRCAA